MKKSMKLLEEIPVGPKEDFAPLNGKRYLYDIVSEEVNNLVKAEGWYFPVKGDYTHLCTDQGNEIRWTYYVHDHIFKHNEIRVIMKYKGEGESVPEESRKAENFYANLVSIIKEYMREKRELAATINT